MGVIKKNRHREKILTELKARFSGKRVKGKDSTAKDVQTLFHEALDQIVEATEAGDPIVTIDLPGMTAPRLREMLIEEGFDVTEWKQGDKIGWGIIEVSGWMRLPRRRK